MHVHEIHESLPRLAFKERFRKLSDAELKDDLQDGYFYDMCTV